jgi:hypothetical protein
VSSLDIMSRQVQRDQDKGYRQLKLSLITSGNFMLSNTEASKRESRNTLYRERVILKVYDFIDAKNSMRLAGSTVQPLFRSHP